MGIICQAQLQSMTVSNVFPGSGGAYDEPRLTCWYGELPYTYSHSTMQANPQVSAIFSLYICKAIEVYFTPLFLLIILRLLV